MVAIAHGNDMGGSIRFPASMCGIVGLKPTRARTTLGPDFGEYWGPLTHEHVLTRSVRDTAAVLDAPPAPGPAIRTPRRRRRGRSATRSAPPPAGCASVFRTRHPRTASASHPDCVAAVAGRRPAARVARATT